MKQFLVLLSTMCTFNFSQADNSGEAAYRLRQQAARAKAQNSSMSNLSFHCGSMTKKGKNAVLYSVNMSFDKPAAMERVNSDFSGECQSIEYSEILKRHSCLAEDLRLGEEIINQKKEQKIEGNVYILEVYSKSGALPDYTSLLGRSYEAIKNYYSHLFGNNTEECPLGVQLLTKKRKEDGILRTVRMERINTLNAHEIRTAEEPAEENTSF